MIQTKENGKNLHFGPDLGPLGLFRAANFFLQKSDSVSL